jgi:hypothetical protein
MEFFLQLAANVARLLCLGTLICNPGAPSDEFRYNKKLITREVWERIESVRTANDIVGLSASVVSLTDGPEWDAWGIRNEEGDPMTTDVLD